MMKSWRIVCEPNLTLHYFFRFYITCKYVYTIRIIFSANYMKSVLSYLCKVVFGILSSIHNYVTLKSGFIQLDYGITNN